MARQRFIHPDLWSDPTLGQLTPVERLFFIGCFSNADDEGRLLGNPAYLRSTIFPYDDMTIEQVKTMRDRVVAICRNLVLYEVDGLEYLVFLKWSQYQKPKYPKPSKLPPPPSLKAEGKQEAKFEQPSPTPETALEKKEETTGEEFHQASGNDGGTLEEDLPPRLGTGRDGLGMGRVRVGELSVGSTPTDERPSPTLPEHTETEREILKELRSVPGYPFDFARDLEYIRTLAVEFPRLDLLSEARSWRTYKLDKPLSKKSNPRLQFRHWCEIAQKECERNGSKRSGKPSGGTTGPPESQYMEYERVWKNA